MTAIDASSGRVAQVLDPTSSDDLRLVAGLRADPTIEFLDTSATQSIAMRRIDSQLADEPLRFVYYPWRRAVVKILGPTCFRRLRLDRNRNLITTEEQDRLGRLRIGVVGLSAGHVIAHTLAMQGMCGELRLADFDDLELSNLNRIPAGVFDLELNKTIVAARRIAELDPYLNVRTMSAGLTPAGIGEFLDDLDVVVEECDSLDVKALLRQECRARRLPVVMATSDRGLVDVERFDLEPDRPIFHGLLGEIDPAELVGLNTEDKVPYVLRLIEVGGLSARSAASLLEVNHTLTTWPQLAGDVTLGAGAVAEAVRRIGLDLPLSSGRIRLDVGAAFDRMLTPGAADTVTTGESAEHAPPTNLVGAVMAAANRAPSGGNVQPWRIVATDDGVMIQLLPERTSTIDIGLRGSAVAVGAAMYNAMVAAAANGAVGRAEYTEETDRPSLRARLRLVEGADDTLAARYESMLSRETNRRLGTGAPLPEGMGEKLAEIASAEGARLRVLASRAEITAIAGIFAAADRIRFLTSRLHGEMISELRWPGDEDPDAGIDVRSLELDAGDVLGLEVLRRPDVMAELSTWDAGGALGKSTASGLEASSAVAVVTARGHSLADYARGGSAVEAIWIMAQEDGLAVQPISPPFLYAKVAEELQAVAPAYAAELGALQSRFQSVIGLRDDSDDSLILVLRLSVASPATVRSRRRTIQLETPPLP